MNAELQRTDRWYADRLGKATASRMDDVCARTKTGWGAGRAKYCAELVVERMTNKKASPDLSHKPAVLWGQEQETPARIAYMLRTGADVVETGFLDHPTIAMSGASPDGLVGERGLIEIKCPDTSTHIDTLLNQSIPQKYMLQMQWQLAVTGRAYCDYVSFDPRMPEGMHIWVHRVERDQKLINELQFMVVGFLSEVDEKVKALRSRYGDK